MEVPPVIAYRQKTRKWKERGIDPRDLARKAYYGSAPIVHKGHLEELEAFARAIMNGTRSPCDEFDGARATACVLAAVRSMESGFLPVNLKKEVYFLNRRST